LDKTLVATIEEHSVDWTCRGFPVESYGISYSALPARGFNVMTGEFSYPIMVLKASELRHNLTWMSSFCRQHKAHLAPHAKTAMAPQLVAAQFEYGAWAVTVATTHQARVFRRYGAQRIILANQLVTVTDLDWALQECRIDNSLELISLVDSVAQVERADRILEAAGAGATELPVLLEVGYNGGRAGARDHDTAVCVAKAVASSRHFRLIGLEGFEGVMPGAGRPEQAPLIQVYLRQVKELFASLRADGLIESPSIMSFGGSAYFDLVVSELDLEWRTHNPCSLVLRSGCYISHDDGMYSRLAPPDTFRPSLEVLAAVTSCPAQGLAIAGVGKRDVPIDTALPIVRGGFRDAQRIDCDAVTVRGLNDHHAFLDDPHGLLKVGDTLIVGISHPCTAFDKWKLIPVVDPDYAVVGAVQTFF
jgi:D-serine dehydratase